MKDRVNEYKFSVIELGDHGIFDEAEFKLAKFKIVLIITAIVVPMLWMGQEFAEYKRKCEFVT